MAPDPVAAKEFYEALDDLVTDGTAVSDKLAEILITMMGLDWDHRRQHYTRNPDNQEQADRVARRWLKHHGYMAR